MKTHSINAVMAAIVASFALSGCGSIYSPTLNLPHDPLMKNQGQMTAAASALPQIGSPSVGFAYSGEGQISYGFSDRLSIGGKTWAQASELYHKNFNGGVALEASYLLNSRTDNISFAIVPTGSMLIDGNTVNAMGASIQLAAWLPEFSIFRPYVAVGPGMLSKNFRDNDWGYGAIWNAGVSAKISDDVRINVEFFGAVERYLKNARFDSYLAPSLSFAWRFDN